MNYIFLIFKNLDFTLPDLKQIKREKYINRIQGNGSRRLN